MDQQQAAEVLRNLDLRTKRMEQILPDLPKREEMHDALQRAVEPLPTRDEMQSNGRAMRRRSTSKRSA